MSDHKEIQPEQFDHTNVEQMTKPYGLYQQFRDQCPVGRSGQHGGFWFVSRYDDVLAVAKNFRTFSNRDGVAIPKQPMPPLYPLDLDPPLHTAFRNLIMPLFLKSEAEKLSAEVDAEVDRLLQPILATGSGDLAELCIHIPAYFALKVIGIDVSATERLLHLVDLLVHERTNEEKAAAAGAELNSFLLGVVAQRRREAPREDALGTLLTTPVPGMGQLDDATIAQFAALMIFGGLHTSRSAMLESLLHIERNPHVRQTLLARFDDAPFWETAIEEFIRHSTPTQSGKRQVTQACTLHGQQLSPGDDVMVMWGSANHDERKFEQPDEVVLERSPNPHLAFGVGAHRCIGQHLARVFIRSVLRRVLTLMPDYRIPADFVPDYQVGESRAMTSLPVELPAQ